MPVNHRSRLVAGAAMALIVATAGCSSTGGKKSEASGSAAVAGKAASTPRMTFAMISHAPEGDAFFDAIQAGAKAAAAKDNIEFKYSGDGSVPGEGNLIQNAIDSKVDGIAVSLPDPAALNPIVLKARAAGIPVVTYNAGDRAWQGSGALAFFGEPEVLAGQAAGSQLAKSGSKHALCVVQAQGQVQLEDRCNGIRSTLTGGKVDEIFSDGTNLPGYVSTVQAKLKQDPSIDAVVTLGPALGVAVAQAVKQSGTKVKVVTYAMNKEVYPLIQNGQIAFTIDQQPYLQGYEAIDTLWLYKTNGNILGANASIPTGPYVVDKANVDSVAKFASNGTR